MASPPVSALDGLRVLEVGEDIAAPYATKLLADLGADVVKVEPPAGDALRRWTPFPDDPGHTGLLFDYLNGAKRSARVDLSTPAGLAWLQATLAGADLLVESLGAGRLEALGVESFPRPRRAGGPPRRRADQRRRPARPLRRPADQPARRPGPRRLGVEPRRARDGTRAGRGAAPRVRGRLVRGRGRAHRAAGRPGRHRAGRRRPLGDRVPGRHTRLPEPRDGGHARRRAATTPGSALPAARHRALPRRMGRHQRPHRPALRRRVHHVRARRVRVRANPNSGRAAPCSPSSPPASTRGCSPATPPRSSSSARRSGFPPRRSATAA